MNQTTDSLKLNKKNFIEFLQLKQRPNTVYLYTFYWKKLVKYLGLEEESEIPNHLLEPQTLRQFVLKHKNNIVVRAFLKNVLIWIRDYEFPQETKVKIKGFELTKKTGRKPQKEMQIRTQKEIHKIAEAMPDDRLQIMTLIGFYLGLRISELCNIQTKDLNLEKQTIQISEWAKNKKERTMAIPPFLIPKFKQYLQIRYTEQPTPQTKIFPIGTNRYAKHLNKASLTAIGEKTKPHTLRRSCGTWLKKKGWSIDEIRQYLDHNTIDTTLKYVKAQEKEEIQNKAKQTFGG